MKHLPALFEDRHPYVTSGQYAVDLIDSNEIDPKDLYIVQEENNPDGLLLQEMGCQKSVIMCLESPIYASRFYDNSVSDGFKHKLFFDGGTEHLHFPSFDTDDIQTPVPWAERKFLCMVTANKHYSGLGGRYKDSPSFQWAMKTQLHDYRYNAIQHFYNKPGFDLYGKGWGLEATECHDKIDTIKNYKYALCFENGSYPGYITEKIIDCFVAGVVPVYIGAPDIYDYIPGKLFIDASLYKNFHEMEDDLMSTWDHPHTSIPAAQEWLKFRGGQKYNNLNFAKRILEMCEGNYGI